MQLRARLGFGRDRQRVRPFDRGRDSALARKLYLRARAFFEEQVENGDYTPEERRYALAHDLLPDKRGLYDFSKYPADAFLTDVECTGFWMIMNKNLYRILLENKLITYQLLSQNVVTPKIHSVYKAGKKLHFGGDMEASATDLFARPLSLRKGRGATRIKTVDYDESVQRLLNNYGDLIVTECVRQHPFMDNLFSGSVNTARIVTIREQQSGRPRTVCAVLRVGTEKSQPVDNFSAGGIGFNLDIESGLIGVGLQNKAPWERFETHPDTGRRITGQVLPGGNKIIEKCLSLHGLLPHWPIVGWDMAIGVDDFILIEANATPYIDFHQAFRPWLLDPEISEFYRSIGVI